MIFGSNTKARNLVPKKMYLTNKIPKKPDKHKIKSNATPLYCIWLCEKAPWGFVWGKIRSLQYKTHSLYNTRPLHVHTFECEPQFEPLTNQKQKV